MRSYIRKLKDAAKKPRSRLGSNQFTTVTTDEHAVRDHFQYLVDSWDLSVDLYETLVTSACYYCGEEPLAVVANVGKRGLSVKKNGIDRVDNSLGYFPSNCVTACETCNKGKNAMSQENFLAIIVKRYNHLGAK